MTTERAGSNNQERVRAVIGAWIDALRSKNAAGVVRHHAPGFVEFSLAPPLVSTAADIAGLEAWFAGWKGALEYEIRNLDITAGDDVAFCHGLTRLRGTGVDGTTSDLWFRQTLCFRRLAGDWKLTHSHESVPFYMDGSFKAAVDLEPSS